MDAALCLLHGQADHMLTVALDLAGDFVRDGFASLKAISPTRLAGRPLRPPSRRPHAAGSAGRACLLGRSDSTPSQEPLCTLAGWGVASDAVHMTTPDRHASGLIDSIRQALAMAHRAPDDIDVILAHGTGTRYNDAMESVAFRTLFGDTHSRQSPGPFITAVKGLIGHTLGASGIIETVLGRAIFAEQRIPPRDEPRNCRNTPT